MINPTTTPTDESTTTPSDRELERFLRSPMQQTLLKELRMLIRPTEAKTCLEIGNDGGAFSFYLRKHGGDWQTLLTSTTAVETTRTLIPDGIAMLTPEQLPFGDNTFDLVVLVDLLETLPNPTPLIDECHRVLRPTGHIALNVPYAGRLRPLRPLRRYLDRRRTTPVTPRREFSNNDLFELLKTGFDVIDIRSYAHFFSELVNIFLQSSLHAIPTDTSDGFDHILKCHRIAHPFFRVAFQLDYLLYPFRGNHLVTLARRHAWLPRNSPVLRKAESITGAVLSTVR